MSSCTFDYFEDETNYVVYVPKADRNRWTENYRIENLDMLIYNGDLSKEKHSVYPFTETSRSRVGNFNFRLYPGSYSVFCFTNAGSVDFHDIGHIDNARFQLRQLEGGAYNEPAAIYVDHAAPTIHFPGPVVNDTARFERLYVGRICIAFKNLLKIDPSLTFSNIKRVEIEAGGVGVAQHLSLLTDSLNTRSTRFEVNDKMKLTAEPFSVQYKDFEFGIQNYYFPSPDLSRENRESEPIHLLLRFVGNNGNFLSSLNISVVDQTNSPVILHMNETLVVEVDGNHIQVLRLSDLEDWNPVIESEDESSPGAGGKEL
jgi:hypothetical protein